MADETPTLDDLPPVNLDLPGSAGPGTTMQCDRCGCLVFVEEETVVKHRRWHAAIETEAIGGLAVTVQGIQHEITPEFLANAILNALPREKTLDELGAAEHLERNQLLPAGTASKIVLGKLVSDLVAALDLDPDGHYSHDQLIAFVRALQHGPANGELTRLRRVEDALVQLGAPNRSERGDPGGLMIAWIQARMAQLEQLQKYTRPERDRLLDELRDILTRLGDQGARERTYTVGTALQAVERLADQLDGLQTVGPFRTGQSWGVTIVHDPEQGEKTGTLWATAQRPEWARRIVSALNGLDRDQPAEPATRRETGWRCQACSHPNTNDAETCEVCDASQAKTVPWCGEPIGRGRLCGNEVVDGLCPRHGEVGPETPSAPPQACGSLSLHNDKLLPCNLAIELHVANSDGHQLHEFLIDTPEGAGTLHAWTDAQGAVPVPWPKDQEPPAGIDILRDTYDGTYLCRETDGWVWWSTLEARNDYDGDAATWADAAPDADGDLIVQRAIGR